LAPFKTDVHTWFEGRAHFTEDSALRNSSLQGAYFIMAARALGLGMGPMSGFDQDAVDAAFSLAAPRRPF
jgi:3-hydroxypropanoate dehydrogenase